MEPVIKKFSVSIWYGFVIVGLVILTGEYESLLFLPIWLAIFLGETEK